MCGIFGEIGQRLTPGDPSRVIAHRGPDDHGTQSFTAAGTPWNIRLSHRRLSIIDLSPLGHQPMQNEDGSVWITFNGEIFNFGDLRRELAGAGHRFASATDTETILHGYEEWGDAVVQRLRGQFAFGLWDQRRQRLLLARDRLGEKPLFYYHGASSFVFASEIKAILATGISPEPDYRAIHDYLTYLYFPPPSTAFRGVSKLPPATCLSVEFQSSTALAVREWEYWDAAAAAGRRSWRNESEYVEEARELMREATQLRLISDVPVGLSLSGGMDSSTITALAAESQERIRTFSVTFPHNREFDEAKFAEIVARRVGAEHRVLQPDLFAAAHLSTVVRHFDEPFGNPTAILQYILTKEMRRHVKVALAGDGGDELFGGYERYRGAVVARLYRRLPSVLTRHVIANASRLLRENTAGRHGYRRLREFAAFAWQNEADMYINWVGYHSEEEKLALYTPEMARAVGDADSTRFLRTAFHRASGLDPISRLSYVDLHSFLSCNCLEYGDRMSMANGLEVRSPFTDHKLVEFALSLPGNAKIRGLTTKWVLKEAMTGILPREILNKRKVGFNPPAPTWLAGELRSIVEQFLGPKSIRERGLFRPEVVQQIQDDHYSGRRDNTFKIWSLLMLELWQRMYLEGQAEDDLRTQIRELIKPRTERATHAGHIS